MCKGMTVSNAEKLRRPHTCAMLAIAYYYSQSRSAPTRNKEHRDLICKSVTHATVRNSVYAQNSTYRLPAFQRSDAGKNSHARKSEKTSNYRSNYFAALFALTSKVPHLLFCNYVLKNYGLLGTRIDAEVCREDTCLVIFFKRF